MMRWLDSKLRHKAWWRKWRGLPEPTPVYLLRAEACKEALKLLEIQLAFAPSVVDAFKAGQPGKTITIRRPQRYVDKP